MNNFNSMGLKKIDLKNIGRIPRGTLPTKKDYKKALGIKSRESISAEIKKIVKERSKNKCEWKGCKETKYLDFHHKNMVNYDNKPLNIMLVCPTHHRAMHDKYKKVVTKHDDFGRAVESKVMSRKARDKRKEKRYRVSDC